MRAIPLLFLLPALVAPVAAAATPAYDLLIRNARVVDGTGRAAFVADVAVKGEAIVAVGRGLKGGAREIIDAKGRVLAPGFIDSHAHGDPLSSSFANDAAQGVTLAVLGQDGRTPGDSGEPEETDNLTFPAWKAKVDVHGSEVNIAALIGFGTLRNASGAGSHEVVTPAQQDDMRRRLRAGLEEGAFGLSSGLEYVPDRFAATAELVDLSQVVGRANGVVESHMRSEDDDKIDAALDELLAQGAVARVHVSHIKVVVGHGAARAEAVLARLRAARAKGVRISADVYPYTGGMADFALDYPPWARRREDFEAAVRDRRPELAAAIHARVLSRNGPAAVMIQGGPDQGLSLEQAANKGGKTFEDYIIDAGFGGPSVAHFVQDQALQDVFVASPLVAISSDGAPAMRHPRSFGSFAKVIETYVGERHMLTLEAAVRKMSGYPAQILDLRDRGRIAPGFKADLSLFDPSAVHARATWADPFRPAQGFDLVLVNGAAVWRDGAATGAKPGHVLGHRPAV